MKRGQIITLNKIQKPVQFRNITFVTIINDDKINPRVYGPNNIGRHTCFLFGDEFKPLVSVK